MTNEQKNIEKQFNELFMNLDLTDEQAENITYLKRYVLEALRIHDVSNRLSRSEQNDEDYYDRIRSGQN